jgi:DMSO/TMAO reductase YedYZ molybdopterin-dependent catalytic subunit
VVIDDGIGGGPETTDRTDDLRRGSPVGRRVFLGVVGAGAIGILAGSAVQGWLERSVGPLITRDPTGLLSLLPIGRFRIYSVTADLPVESRADYRLRVRGLVDTELDLDFADLLAMEPLGITRDFQCVTGWRVPDVAWRGVRLRDLLDRAGVQSDATAVRFVSFDGAYSESLTLGQARRDDVMVAYELEGEQLSSAHGGPARLYVAPMYGYKSLKWLRTIELTDGVVPGYWEQRGYDVDAWVGRSNGRDDEAT